MDEPRPTRLPWEVDTQRGWVFYRTGPLERVVIAELQHDNDADLYLIAAAPEMLEALMLHIAYEATPRDRGGHLGPKRRAWAAYVAARDAALAKAKRQ